MSDPSLPADPNASAPAPQAGPNPVEMMVQITEARLEEYRMHRQAVDGAFKQLDQYVGILKDNDFPIDLKRTSQNTAKLVDADGEKVMDLEFKRLRPIMLYPTDLVEKQQAAQQAAASRAGQGIPKDVSPMIENDDDDDGMNPPGSVPRIPGPNPSYPGEIVGGSDAIILSSGEDADAPEGDEPEIEGPEEDNGKRRGMTRGEIEEAAAEAATGPDGKPLPPGTRVIQLDPTRGIPASPSVQEGIEVRAYTNIANQPQGMSATSYNLSNPVDMHTFMAHIADVAAYVKDLHDSPAAERTGDYQHFHNTRGIGFTPGGP